MCKWNHCSTSKSRDNISCAQATASQWVNVAAHKIEAGHLKRFKRFPVSVAIAFVRFGSSTFAVGFNEDNFSPSTIALLEVCTCVWAAACLLSKKTLLYSTGHRRPPRASMGHFVLCLQFTVWQSLKCPNKLVYRLLLCKTPGGRKPLTKAGKVLNVIQNLQELLTEGERLGLTLKVTLFLSLSLFPLTRKPKQTCREIPGRLTDKRGIPTAQITWTYMQTNRHREKEIFQYDTCLDSD